MKLIISLLLTLSLQVNFSYIFLLCNVYENSTICWKEYFSNLVFLSFTQKVLNVSSHGRFTNPPSRASAWRYGFDTPADYDDNGNNCGGFSNQWNRAGGKCGICGDDWFADPREHEAPGGLYATGTIVNSYSAGQTIPVTIEITANHWGHFEFKLCANNDVTKDPKQDCFDK